MYQRNIKHSRVKNLFKFASLKNRASLTLESSLEFDACFHFEYSKSISAFKAQPVGFRYQYYGKCLPYTPDFWVSTTNGKQTYYEVKCSKEASDPEVNQRLRYKQQSCIELGIELKLITERQLHKGPLLNNLKLLHRYAGESKYHVQFESIILLVSKLGVVTIRELLNKSEFTQGELNKHVLTGASQGLLLFDLGAKPFGLDTELSTAYV
ncbi:Tn7 transposase TnsA N-terminal domain-containing protein [Shewanella surugensis]|uniref:Tn7 transposase TnsA N-terminal domain-containing protein n=1 Tax=Shewanella surugensis TaxID=212020 RepID=A0ABT0LDW3_9GAMM|nr:Tn7 transposase TnsA N-terminal domain-containing protein [Shewanella surugensis]MCL1125517.1 Tn7 transposase TnsA N-terminal domain-containing protein [Shewanella surugensis]